MAADIFWWTFAVPAFPLPVLASFCRGNSRRSRYGRRSPWVRAGSARCESRPCVAGAASRPKRAPKSRGPPGRRMKDKEPGNCALQWHAIPGTLRNPRTGIRKQAWELSLELGLAAAADILAAASHYVSMLDQLVFARSTPPLTPANGPEAVGVISKLKISVGKYSVAQAFGISTIPLMRPSTGAVPRMA